MGDYLYLLLLNCFGIFDVSNGFPIDLSSVGTGQFSSAWSTLSPVLAICIVVIALFGCVCCRNGKGFQEFNNSNGNLCVVQPNDGFVNPTASSELPIFPPSGFNANPPERSSVIKFEPLPDIRAPHLRPASFSYGEQEISAEDWFYEPHANFPRSHLKYVEEYGRGWFGRVVQGEAQNIRPNESISKVIVKILHEDATAADQMYFLHEVKMFRDLSHPNILRLWGRCLETEPFLVLLAYYPNGDLKTFLTQNLASARALTEQGVTLKMCCNISTGLQYLHENKFIHTDLAARNCLVAPDLTIKIGDYGNSIQMFPNDYYCAGSVALPVRWCAPETLKCSDVVIETKEVTPLANVWSLGVVLWEICEFGRLPYEELNDDQVIVKVLGDKNYFLEKPKLFCLHKDDLYHLMKLCWNPPLQRPTVSQITAILNNLMSGQESLNPLTLDTKIITQDFEQRWQHSKPNCIPVTDNSVERQSSPLFRSAKVSDSSIESPLGGFLLNAKQSAHDSPRFTLKSENKTADEEDSLEEIGETKRVHFNLRDESKDVYKIQDPDFDSWLKGVEVKNEEDERFVRKISEAIRDLDEALALENSSSSSESCRNSPGKDTVPDFILGGDTNFINSTPKSFELSSLQNTQEPESLLFHDEQPESLICPVIKQTNDMYNVSDDLNMFEKQSIDSKNSIFANVNLFPSTAHDSLKEFMLQSRTSSDTEDEQWRKRIERGEFSEKVKEKSKSIADLMILTHIDTSEESDDDGKGSLGRRSEIKSLSTSTNFGSENNLKNTVLEEAFKESLMKLSNDHKEHGKFDSLNMILPTNVRKELVFEFLNCELDDRRLLFEPMEDVPKTVEPDHFLGNVASEYQKNNIKSHYKEVQVSACSELDDRANSRNIEQVEEEKVVLESCETKLETCESDLSFSSQNNKHGSVSEKEIIPLGSLSSKHDCHEIISTSTPFDKKWPAKDSDVSVILGACVEYSLDYFNGLKTTFGGVDLDYNQVECAKVQSKIVQDPPVQCETVSSNCDSIETWNKHLNNTLIEQINQTNFDDVSFSLSLESPMTDEQISPVKDVLGSSFVATPVSVSDKLICDDAKDSGQIQSCSSNESVENDSNDMYDIHINRMTSLNENIEDFDKLTTPDDERSSDSGFRDKGSLSESVEDACEGKYKLEDIEAELQDAYVKGAFVNCELVDDKEVDKQNVSNRFEYEESKFYEDENSQENELDGEMEYWPNNDSNDYYKELSEMSPKNAQGWYLHPPDDNKVNYDNLDDDFVNALRDELKDKLPSQTFSDFEFEEEEKSNINVQYVQVNNFNIPLSPIFEEGEECSSEILINELTYDISNSDSRENLATDDIFDDDEVDEFSLDNLQNSPKKTPERKIIDSEMFKKYLDDMIETEGNSNITLTNETMIDKDFTDKNMNALYNINLDNIFDTADEPSEQKTENTEDVTTYSTAQQISSTNLHKSSDNTFLSAQDDGKVDDSEMTFSTDSVTSKEEDRDILEDIDIKEDETKELDVPMFIISKYESNNVDNFENDIRNALGLESYSEYYLSDSEQPKSLVLFQDLESNQFKSEVVNETKQEDDGLLIDTETNEAVLLESPKPKSCLAFTQNSCDVDDFTPDSISPESENDTISDVLSKSNTDEALSNVTSPDGLSDFFSTPVTQSPKVTKVERICLEVKNNEAADIINDLENIGVLDTRRSSTLSEDSLEKSPERMTTTNKVDLFLKHEQQYASNFVENQLRETAKKLEVLQNLEHEMSTSFIFSDDDPEEISNGAVEQNQTDKMPTVTIEITDTGGCVVADSAVQVKSVEGGKTVEEVDKKDYTPDWETDSSSSTDESSSSGEFIWKLFEDTECDRKQAGVEDAQTQQQLTEDVVDDDDDDEDDDESSTGSSASITDFVPSAWNCQATPSRSALRSPDKKLESNVKRNVWFKKQKYHCVYEYPREPSDDEDAQQTGPATHLTDNKFDYSSYADWELLDDNEGEVDVDLTDTDSDNSTLVNSNTKQLPVQQMDFYTISHDTDLLSSGFGTMSDDSEFFVSSSARPFQYANTSSQFFPGGGTGADLFQDDENDSCNSSPTGLGELRHKRYQLQLNLDKSLNKNKGEDDTIADVTADLDTGTQNTA